MKERNRLATEAYERKRIEAGYGEYEAEARDKEVRHFTTTGNQHGHFSPLRSSYSCNIARSRKLPYWAQCYVLRRNGPR